MYRVALHNKNNKHPIDNKRFQKHRNQIEHFINDLNDDKAIEDIQK